LKNEKRLRSAFDLLTAGGVDLRPLLLSDRKARLAKIAQQAEGSIALTNCVVGVGYVLCQAVVDAGLEASSQRSSPSLTIQSSPAGTRS